MDPVCKLQKNILFHKFHLWIQFKCLKTRNTAFIPLQKNHFKEIQVAVGIWGQMVKILYTTTHGQMRDLVRYLVEYQSISYHGTQSLCKRAPIESYLFACQFLSAINTTWRLHQDVISSYISNCNPSPIQLWRSKRSQIPVPLSALIALPTSSCVGFLPLLGANYNHQRTREIYRHLMLVYATATLLPTTPPSLYLSSDHTDSA